MTTDTSKLMKTLLAAVTLGVFAIAVAMPLTVDLGAGALTAKSALAKDGADDGAGPDDGGSGGNGADNGADDGGSGGHGADD